MMKSSRVQGNVAVRPSMAHLHCGARTLRAAFHNRVNVFGDKCSRDCVNTASTNAEHECAMPLSFLCANILKNLCSFVIGSMLRH
jgi:hypothetical protein